MLITAFHLLCRILLGLLLASAILSWFVNPYTVNRYGALYRIYTIINRITEPLTRPARKLLSRFRTGPIDFSVLLTMLFIMMLENIVSWFVAPFFRVI